MAVKLSQHRKLEKSPSNHGLLDHWVTFRVTVCVGSLCGVVYITWRLEKNVKHLYALGSSSCFQSSLRTAASWIHAREGAVGIAVFLMWCLVRKSSNTTMYEGLFLLPKLLDLFFFVSWGSRITLLLLLCALQFCICRILVFCTYPPGLLGCSPTWVRFVPNFCQTWEI